MLRTESSFKMFLEGDAMTNSTFRQSTCPIGRLDGAQFASRGRGGVNGRVGGTTYKPAKQTERATAQASGRVRSDPLSNMRLVIG